MSIDIQILDKFADLARAVNRGSFRSLNHAAASIRKAAIAGILIHPDPSPVGTPVHSRYGLFKAAILYSVDKDKQDAVIGTRYSMVDDSGEPHEKGTFYRGQQFDKRPFMQPALLRSIPRLSKFWEYSAG